MYLIGTWVGGMRNNNKAGDRQALGAGRWALGAGRWALCTMCVMCCGVRWCAVVCYSVLYCGVLCCGVAWCGVVWPACGIPYRHPHIEREK